MLVFDIDEQWVSDLIEVQIIAKENKGFRYILVVVDAFSKYAWAVPLKKKTGEEVTDAFTKIVKQGRKPQKLQTDAGKEFYNKTFQTWLARYSPFFHARRCKSEYCRTIHSYFKIQTV